MSNLLQFLLRRTFASRALDVVKMKPLVPCEVDNPRHKYKTTITEVVYDPLTIEEVNAQYKAAGYEIEEGMQVIAATKDGSLLLWGGMNSVYRLRKGEKMGGLFDEKHLVFDDILDLTERFKIKNKKVEIDELVAKLDEKYGEE